MYASYFGLKREPFSIAPDPRYLFMSERHREALAHLLYGVGGGGGFVLLTGEIGAGKTTVCRCFLEQVPRRCNVAYIFNPKLTVLELLQSVCQEFRIPCEGLDASQATVKAYLDRLNEFLLRMHSVGQNNVLIIDEAQNLSPDVLEQLRLLTNLETSERKLLQIILIGQPELRDMLNQPELEQLAQRVIARYHLEALSEAETGQYIAHRLAVAGYKHEGLFEPHAVARVHQLTRGVPRRINLLCDRALLGTYASGQAKVSPDIVGKAGQEVFDTQAAAPRASGTGWQDALDHTLGRIFGRTLDRTLSRTTSGNMPDAQGHAMRRKWLAGGTAVASVLLTALLAAWAVHRTPAEVSGPTGRAMAGAPLASQASQVAVGASGAAMAQSQSPATGARSEQMVSGEVIQAHPAAGGATAQKASLTPPPFDWEHGFDQALRSEEQAWRQLASHWGVSLPQGKACQVVESQSWRCFKAGASLTLIRQLDRPGVVTLFDLQGHAAYALLLGLDEQQAVLNVGDQIRRVGLQELSRMWRGDFATFWRAPDMYKGKVAEGQKGPMVDWLAQRLAAIQGDPPPSGPQKLDALLKAKIHAFQLTQGLMPDGLPGPPTIMLINRAMGVDEPRLQEPRRVQAPQLQEPRSQPGTVVSSTSQR